jgi:hypothetical protein
MGRSFRREESDERDRKRVRKHSKKNHRNQDKTHLREYTSGNLSSDDFLDLEEEEDERKGKPRF